MICASCRDEGATQRCRCQAFHDDCLAAWLRRSSSPHRCPICRTAYPRSIFLRAVLGQIWVFVISWLTPGGWRAWWQDFHSTLVMDAHANRDKIVKLLDAWTLMSRALVFPHFTVPIVIAYCIVLFWSGLVSVCIWRKYDVLPMELYVASAVCLTVELALIMSVSTHVQALALRWALWALTDEWVPVQRLL